MKDQDWFDQLEETTNNFFATASDEDVIALLIASGSVQCETCSTWIGKSEVRGHGCRLCNPTPEDTENAHLWNVLDRNNQ